MYKVGDKIVHPHHGAGVVAALEQSDLLDDFNRYYVIELAVQQMRLMVPVRMADEIGLRPVAPPEHLDEVLEILNAQADSLPDDFKARQADIHERLRVGTPESLARVVRDMACRGRDKTYSPTEQRLYEQARTMLGSELALSRGTEVTAALALIDTQVDLALRADAVGATDETSPADASGEEGLIAPSGTGSATAATAQAANGDAVA